MKVVDMATVSAKRPTMMTNRAQLAGAAGLFRTAGAAPATRLTPRGRLTVTGVSALLAGALSCGLATAAQASHTGPAAPGGYVTRVEVLPGQSLWSIAEAHAPDADTRVIIHEIQQLNAMTSDQVQPGESLWVPRG
jgi:LysM domain-containing protein